MDPVEILDRSLDYLERADELARLAVYLPPEVAAVAGPAATLVGQVAGPINDALEEARALRARGGVSAEDLEDMDARIRGKEAVLAALIGL